MESVLLSSKLRRQYGLSLISTCAKIHLEIHLLVVEFHISFHVGELLSETECNAVQNSQAPSKVIRASSLRDKVSSMWSWSMTSSKITRHLSWVPSLGLPLTLWTWRTMSLVWKGSINRKSVRKVWAAFTRFSPEIGQRSQYFSSFLFTGAACWTCAGGLASGHLLFLDGPAFDDNRQCSLSLLLIGFNGDDLGLQGWDCAHHFTHLVLDFLHFLLGSIYFGSKFPRFIDPFCSSSPVTLDSGQSLHYQGHLFLHWWGSISVQMLRCTVLFSS